jgi:hypothetical protein
MQLWFVRSNVGVPAHSLEFAITGSVHDWRVLLLT